MFLASFNCLLDHVLSHFKCADVLQFTNSQRPHVLWLLALWLGGCNKPSRDFRILCRTFLSQFLDSLNTIVFEVGLECFQEGGRQLVSDARFGSFWLFRFHLRCFP